MATKRPGFTKARAVVVEASLKTGGKLVITLPHRFDAAGGYEIVDKLITIARDLQEALNAKRRRGN